MKRKAVSKVEAGFSGLRLADYLGKRFSYLRTEEWRRHIVEGRVRVNGVAPEKELVLASGDLVAFDPSDIEEPEVDSAMEIVMEDSDFLVVDKSGSLPCHPGGSFFEHTLWYILEARYGPTHIVTRLDRETSGLVLVAKSPMAARYAQDLMVEGSLRKEYMALIHGVFPDRLEARGFMMRDETSVVRKKRKFVAATFPTCGGASETCETLFERAGRIASSTGAISLVRAYPRTGRTHQIRATLLASGFPIVGDKLYGLDEGFFLRFAAGELSASDLSRLMLPGQALHCAELAFTSLDGRAIIASSEPRWELPAANCLDEDRRP